MPRLLLLSPVAPWPPDTGARQRTFLLLQALRETHAVDLLLVGGEPPPADQQAVLTREFSLIGHLPDDPGRLGVRHWVFPWPLIGTPLRRLTRLGLGARRTLFRSPVLAAALQRLAAGPPAADIAGAPSGCGPTVDPPPAGYAAIVSRYLWPAVQTDAFALAPVWVDVDDLDSEIWDAHARSAQQRHSRTAVCARHIATAYRDAERQQLARCTAAWVTKSRDLAAVAGRPAALLPNIPLAAWPDGVIPVPWPEDAAGPDQPAAGDTGTGSGAISGPVCSPPPARRHVGTATGTRPPVVLGIALFDHPPNRQGFDWFIQQVWPQVHARHPEARLRLVGRLSCARTRTAWQAVAGVELAGRLDALRPAYADSAFTIAPLFSGGGTNIKVIESLAHGRACVLTPHAAKGFDALAGLRVSEGAADFAADCIALLDEPCRARALGEAAATAARTEGSWPRFRAAVHDLMSAEGAPR
ncbi:glycosyltransferase family 4 protein [Pseudaquabacterium rugosum]|uniref:Glycosyltransferase family 4 protein n=1 Tax=Pseudaquabacterium rugosum TaxID=2984194 RepID=A0ABU9BDS8_9BURK